VTVDLDALRVAFAAARSSASLRARWSADDPSLPSDTCRYCGKFWRQRFGSQLDGHAACLVTEDFKHRVGAVLRSSPQMTYALVAEIIGVTPGCVRSWAFSAGIAGPTGHALRRIGNEQ